LSDRQLVCIYFEKPSTKQFCERTW